MTNATERKILRWFHIIASIPIIGYVYGPVAEKPEAVMMVRYFLFPAVVLTGLWMWKGLWLKNWIKKKAGNQKTGQDHGRQKFGIKNQA